MINILTKFHDIWIKTKNSKSHAHLQIMMKHSAKFQVNLIKDVAGVVGTRYEAARTITLSKMAETKIRNHMHIFIMIRRQSTTFQIKGGRPSVPRHVKCQSVVNMSITCMLKNAIKGIANSLPSPSSKPLPWSNTAWAFLNSLVHFKTHIINILLFF